ncbi:MAG TPA: VWA domain-containing protein [Candidatus Binatus sp.]|nr:VWA domain-containing protein [Candidatus Binatus sp.]
MAPVIGKSVTENTTKCPWGGILIAVGIGFGLAITGAQAQSGGQTQPPPPAGSNPAGSNPASSKPAQDIPDAPSTVQPPAPAAPPAAGRGSEPIPYPGEAQQTPDQTKQDKSQNQDQNNDKQPIPPMPPVETVPAGSTPRNQISAGDDLYKLVVKVNYVSLPVMVKDSSGHAVDGLLARDFSVFENGKKQNLTYFTSDPFELSVAVVLDIGMSDVALQKVNQTYTALVGAFSPYDEVALYTYSSTVSQVTDFTGRPERLNAALTELKQVRGVAGPPVLGGPLGPGGPTVNGAPVGGPVIQPVNTPARESHVLNDAILRAALDLSKREKTRRKVIFVISDGREMGSRASYDGVRHLLQTRDIQVRAVVVDSGALPGFRQLEKFHLPDQGRTNNLAKFVRATCGADPLPELSRNAIEDAYSQMASEARNQYTLGYTPLPVTGASAYRDIEVRVDRKGLKVAAKDGYYAIPSAR